MGKLVELSRAKIKEGRREARTQKELLVYLMYIEMLGHDTAWAQATAIQLCSDKNLVVKKVGLGVCGVGGQAQACRCRVCTPLVHASTSVHLPACSPACCLPACLPQLAYLTVSLLLDPASELSIMVVATIQADLRSDNFLTAATALSAICHIVTPELVGVFLPQVVTLLRHAKDAVKQKALLALQRCLQVDPSLAPEVERHLIEKIGYKVRRQRWSAGGVSASADTPPPPASEEEMRHFSCGRPPVATHTFTSSLSSNPPPLQEPSVMVAALCGLHELIRRDPAPYRNLVHYFTNILKQVGGCSP